MSNGALGKVMSVAGQEVTAYTVPSNALFATVTLNLVNTGTEDAKVRISFTTATNPGPLDAIEYDAVIPANGGTLERTCMLMSANEKVVLFSDKATVALRVSGLEEIPAGV